MIKASFINNENDTVLIIGDVKVIFDTADARALLKVLFDLIMPTLMPDDEPELELEEEEDDSEDDDTEDSRPKKKPTNDRKKYPGTQDDVLDFFQEMKIDKPGQFFTHKEVVDDLEGCNLVTPKKGYYVMIANLVAKGLLKKKKNEFGTMTYSKKGR